MQIVLQKKHFQVLKQTLFDIPGCAEFIFKSIVDFRFRYVVSLKSKFSPCEPVALQKILKRNTNRCNDESHQI